MNDFHYRLPGRIGGQRPGAHAGSSHGAGQEFITHASLYARPDPRRLDVRGSLRDPRGDWLVRVMRQRVGVALHALVDVSASMCFGAPRMKIEVAADFVEAMGGSAYRVGDAAGMIAFDTRLRGDLHQPASFGRGAGPRMAALLRARAARDELPARGLPIDGLIEAAQQLAARQALVFIVSDFLWDAARLDAALAALARAHVVPLLVRDRAESEPPAEDGLVALRDAESGARRTLWLRGSLRRRWRAAAAAHREALLERFRSHGLRPFELVGRFDAEALSRHFIEGGA